MLVKLCNLFQGTFYEKKISSKYKKCPVFRTPVLGMDYIYAYTDTWISRVGELYVEQGTATCILVISFWLQSDACMYACKDDYRYVLVFELLGLYI